MPIKIKYTSHQRVIARLRDTDGWPMLKDTIRAFNSKGEKIYLNKIWRF